MNETKREKEADSARLDQLLKTKESLARVSDMEIHLRELCSRIVTDLDNCSAQDKKDAFSAWTSGSQLLRKASSSRATF